MAAVQPAERTVSGDLDVDDPPRPEEHRLPPALVDRAVAEEPEVRGESVPVAPQDVRQMRRTRFLLPFEEELHVDGRRTARGSETVERRRQAHDRRLVIRRRPCVEEVFPIDGRSERRPRDVFSAAPGRRVANDGLPRFSGPTRGIDRLTVVVREKDDRPLRPGRRKLPVHCWRAALPVEQGRAHAAFLEQRDDRRGIPADVGVVGSEVRNREQVGEP
jgi:hypothetical protein